MRAEILISTGLLIVAILMISFFALNYYLYKKYQKRHEVMKEKFVTYLRELDEENESLQAGKIRIKPKKDYEKLIG